VNRLCLFPVAVLALLVAATLTTAAVPGPAGAKPGCLKIHHKKRVAKTIVVNGKKKTVYRWKEWFTCDPYESPGPPRLGIAAVEYKFTLSRPVIKSGNLILEYNNRGEDAHNLRIRKIGAKRLAGAIPDTDSRETVTDTFKLHPGRYRLWCALPNHARLGMKAKLKVVR